MKQFNYKIQIVILVVLCLLDMSGTAYIVYWREGFWAAVSNKQVHQFFVLISYFTIAALLLCLIMGLEQYVMNKLALNWRRILTRKAFSIRESRTVEGHQQRIQEDCRDYPLLWINLIQLVGMQAIMSVFFIYVIAHNTGALLTLIPLVYSLSGTVLSYWVAYPLIKLNYLNQVKEAAFRQSLTRLDYAKVHRNNHELFIKTKHLNYFQYFFGQLTAIFPYLIIAGSYFSGKMVFGVYMQTASTISHLTDALGSLVNNFDKINRLLSCRKRLKEMGVL